MTEPHRAIHNVTVFTGSAFGADERFRAEATEVVDYLAGQGIGLVYGGGHVGLMGVVANAGMAAGVDVVGIIPKTLVDAEVGHDGLTRLEVVDDMHQRKTRMAMLGDAFVALPGGLGTLEELFEIWTWQQLGFHVKPVAVYASTFWAPLLELVDHLVERGFVSRQARDSLIVADDPASLLRGFEQWVAPKPKWQKD